MVNCHLADKNPEKRYGKELLSVSINASWKPMDVKLPVTHNPGFQSCLVTFQKWSIVVLCFVQVALVLFCGGRITLLPLPLIHPVCSFPLRGTFYSLPCTGSQDAMAERHSITTKRDHRRKTRGGDAGVESLGAWLHLSGGVVRKKRMGNGEQGEQMMWIGFIHLWEPGQVGKKPFSYTLAGLLDEVLGCLLVSPANEATLIFQFWLDSLSLVGYLGSVWPKDRYTGIKWQMIQWVVKKKVKSSRICSNSHLVSILMSPWKSRSILFYFK